METKMTNSEELLKRLLTLFYVSSYGGLAWSYIEGVTIRDLINEEFELALLPFLDDETASEFKMMQKLISGKDY